MNNNSKSTLQVFDGYKPTIKNEMEANMEETKTDYCKMCGKEFTVRYRKHKYCCYECRMSYSNRRKKEIRKGVYKTITKPSVTMGRMLELMAQLSKEHVRVVQYGEAQKKCC